MRKEVKHERAEAAPRGPAGQAVVRVDGDASLEDLEYASFAQKRRTPWITRMSIFCDGM